MEAGVLRLLAQDADELGIVAAAVQDALVRPHDMKFDKRGGAFGLEMNRFQWEKAGKRAPFFRSRAMLGFTGVRSVRSANLPPGEDAMLALLDVRFASAAEPPGGVVTLVFAEKTLIELTVECLDVTLMDTGVAWPTRRKPDHGKRE